MGQYCCMNDCKNSERKDKKKGVKRHYYRVPEVYKKEGEKLQKSSEERRDKWIRIINKNVDFQSSATRVCSDHFINGECG